jgi:hypothetical protein
MSPNSRNWRGCEAFYVVPGPRRGETRACDEAGDENARWSVTAKKENVPPGGFCRGVRVLALDSGVGVPVDKDPNVAPSFQVPLRV